MACKFRHVLDMCHLRAGLNLKSYRHFPPPFPLPFISLLHFHFPHLLSPCFHLLLSGLSRFLAASRAPNAPANRRSICSLIPSCVLDAPDQNGVNILKSIDEGPFQMGTFRETLGEGDEGALHLGPERPRVYSDMSPKDKDRYNADIRATNILLQGLPKDIYSLINHYTDAKTYGVNVNQREPQNSEYFKDKMLLMQAQRMGVALDEEQLLLGGQDNTVDEDVDEQPVQGI
ncbi:hypothetical protein Tco_0729891 [Tanacetum coccineum]|uniref:Uncharacterized protein n=1 Tax=Tanacetum coccineum TaxID=301880 RepID=A0ABQ4YQN7_9ASTR